jgi:hypothetical protein
MVNFPEGYSLGRILETTKLDLDVEPILLSQKIQDILPSSNTAEHASVIIIAAYSLYRRLRRDILDAASDEIAQRHVNTLQKIAAKISVTLDKGSLDDFEKLAAQLSRYDHLASSRNHITKMGGGMFKTFVSILAYDFEAKEWKEMYQCLFAANQQYYRENGLEYLDNGTDFFFEYRKKIEEGQIKRIHLLGPIASGWSESIFSMLACLKDQEGIKTAIGIPAHVGIEHSPVVFTADSKTEGKVVLPHKSVESGDLLIVVDDSMNPRRRRQLRSQLTNDGYGRDVFILGE